MNLLIIYPHKSLIGSYLENEGIRFYEMTFSITNLRDLKVFFSCYNFQMAVFFFCFQETKYKSLENRLTFPSCQLFTKFSVVNLGLIPGSITSSFLIFIFSVWKNTFNKSWKQFNDNKCNTLWILRSVRIVQMIDLFSFFCYQTFSVKWFENLHQTYILYGRYHL